MRDDQTGLNVVEPLESSEDRRAFARQRVLYGRAERPVIEVCVDDTWRSGRLCYHVEDSDGVWWTRAIYYHPEHRAPRLGQFRSHHVRRAATRFYESRADPA